MAMREFTIPSDVLLASNTPDKTPMTYTFDQFIGEFCFCAPDVTGEEGREAAIAMEEAMEGKHVGDRVQLLQSHWDKLRTMAKDHLQAQISAGKLNGRFVPRLLRLYNALAQASSVKEAKRSN